ncbi:MAG TPA: hypothetical protein EYP98_02025, partial [Planctomycetes bacterium]|nr:hypothetical protein [Planctomycetota bacterium]
RCSTPRSSTRSAPRRCWSGRRSTSQRRRWACFFAFLAILNEIVWRTVSTDTWVSFKVFAIMPLTMAFAVAQVGLLRKYEQPTD